VDAACGILDRRPHGRSDVPDRHGQEDAGEVNENMRGVRGTKGRITLGDAIQFYLIELSFDSV
jgi:hypothetical protein